MAGSILGEMSREEVLSILGKHKDKNFVQRIMAPGIHPVIPAPGGDPGSYATHIMAAEVDPRFHPPKKMDSYVFPTVVQGKDGKMLHIDDVWKALEYAQQTGEFIPFDTIQDAVRFSENYKKAWQ